MWWWFGVALAGDGTRLVYEDGGEVGERADPGRPLWIEQRWVNETDREVALPADPLALTVEFFTFSAPADRRLGHGFGTGRSTAEASTVAWVGVAPAGEWVVRTPLAALEERCAPTCAAGFWEVHIVPAVEVMGMSGDQLVPPLGVDLAFEVRGEVVEAAPTDWRATLIRGARRTFIDLDNLADHPLWLVRNELWIDTCNWRINGAGVGQGKGVGGQAPWVDEASTVVIAPGRSLRIRVECGIPREATDVEVERAPITAFWPARAHAEPPVVVVGPIVLRD